ncbi:MAG: choice-of-anchor Q domain-containing protein [Flavobacteriaceae bacterium]
MKKKIIFLAVILMAILLCRVSDKQNQKMLVKGFGKEAPQKIINPMSLASGLRDNQELDLEQEETKGIPFIGKNREALPDKEYDEAVSLVENKVDNGSLLREFNQKQNEQPLLFLENKGQILDTEGNPRPDILYTAKSNAASVFVASSALHYQFTNIKTDSCSQTIRETHRFTVQLENVNPEPLVETSEPETYTEHYYNERFPEGLKGVRSFTEITLKDIYPGIDWVIYGKGNFMEYDFIVHPGADPKQIRFRINDADKASLTENGDLKMETRLGEVLKHAPISFVEEQQVASHFEVYDDGSYGFDVIAPKGKTLRIDPYVEWATYYGGADDDSGTSCAVDAAGNVYLAGTTEGNGSIAQHGYTTTINIGNFTNTLQGGLTYQGSKDAFLVKFNSSGVRQRATYYGGSGDDQGAYVAVSPSNYVYLVGTTTSTSGIAYNVPEHTPGNTTGDIKPQVLTSKSDSKQYGFLAKFDSNFDRKWAGYYTSRYNTVNRSSSGISCGFNHDGSEVYLLEEFAFTKSVPDWVQPLLWAVAIATALIPGAQGVAGVLISVAIAGVGVGIEAGLNGWEEGQGVTFGAQLLRLDALDGSYMNHSIILGEDSSRPTKAGGLAVAIGTNLDAIPYVLVSATDDRLSGLANGTEFDYTPNPGSITGDIGYQAVVIRYSADLSSTKRQRYYGGSGQEMGKGIAVDPSNEWVVYITGFTRSENNIYNNGYSSTKKGDFDAFLAKINMYSGNMVWSTYFGGWGNDMGTDVKVAPDGSVYLAGITDSEEMGHKGYDNLYSGNGDGFLAKFSSDGQQLLMYTYVGGISTDVVSSIAVRTNNKVYVAGTTHSGNGIVRKGYGYKTGYTSQSLDEAFLIKYTEPNPSDGRLYVKKGGTGSKTGSSWSNALPELADALVKAEYTPGINEIWVAGGEYKPYYRPDHLSAGNDNEISKNTKLQTFKLVNNVKMYGNFAGTETSLEQRDLTDTISVSILSGIVDLSGNTTGKAHHVVLSSGNVGTAELNGFTIKGGEAKIGEGESNTSIQVNGNQITKEHGGGMYIHSSSPKIVNCIFMENTGVYGGAIHSRGNSNPELINCTFKGNAADENGGAIDSYNTGNIKLVNSVISGNKAKKGAAIYHAGTTSQLINTTVAANVSTESGNEVIDYESGASVIQNSIIYGNTNGLKNAENITVSYSLVQGLTNTDNGNLNGDTTNPLFVIPVAVISNSSAHTTGDYRLQDISPAINAGSNNYVAHFTDPDGNDRITNGTADMGAYEVLVSVTADENGIVYVKQGGKGNGSSWENATGDLQTAIKTSGATQVWVAGGTYKPIFRPDNIASLPNEGNNTFLLVNNVKVYGSFAGTETALEQRDLSLTENESILDGAYYAHHVVMASGNVGTAELNGFTITGGNAMGGDSQVTVNGNQITKNHGGGMFLHSSSPKIVNCIFRENIAVYGGGVHSRAGSSPEFINCAFMGNTASLNGGGADSFGATPKFVNCVITGNKAQSGGAMFHYQATSQLINATVAGNLTTGLGVIDYAGGASVIQNSIFYGNNKQVHNAEAVTISYSLVQGLTDTDNGNLSWNTDPMFVNPVLDSDAPTIAGDYRLQVCSPVTNAGNNDYITDYITDLDGNDRITNGTVDMGAFEYDGVPCGVIWTVNNEWLNNIEPTINDDVIIQGDLAVGTDYGSFLAKTLTVENTGSLVITSNNSVTVAGEITNNTGISDFVVENDANLIQTIAYTGTNTGAITVKRESSLIKHLDYTLWSSPVTEQGLRAFSPQTLWYRIYDYNATTDQWNQIFGNSSDDDVDFQEGVGYMFRAPNNFVTTPYTYNGEFKGIPNNGDVTVTFNSSETYQGVGNPYPSNISIQQFKNVNGTGALYFWTNTNAWNDSIGNYVGNNWAIYNGVGGIAAANDNKAPNAFIPVGQGFVFQTAANSVTFTNVMRTSNEGVFFKTMDEDKHRLWLNLSDDEQILNQTLIGYTGDATQGLDFGIDAKLFGYSGSALYSLIENTEDDFVIQGRALPFDDNDVVPLGFRANEAGSYTISLADFDGIFAEGQDIYLRDNFTQTEQNLKNGNYSFVSEQGIFNTRFEVIYKQSGALNVTNPDLNNSWVVYKQNKVFHIFSEGFEMKEVEVYDMLGRIIYASEAEGNSHILPYLGANQVLIVKITTTENEALSKKVQN